MTSRNKRILTRIAIVLMIVILVFTILLYFKNNFEYNITNSLPLGLYKVIDKDIERNDLVVFCLKYDKYMKFAEEQGYFQGLDKKCGRTPQFIKKAMGLPSDNIRINMNGVFINNIRVENSEASQIILSDKIFDSYEKEFQLEADEYFLMSDYNSMSYDSRYFGTVKKSEIKKVVEPFYNY